MSAQAIDPGACISTADERPSMDGWFKSDAFQQLVQATREGDTVRRSQVIEEAIAATDGAEKAFWLLNRCGIRANAAVRAPAMLDRAWGDLEEAFRIAPTDDRIRGTVLHSALSLCLRTQDLRRMAPILRALRRDMARLKHGHFVNYNFGILQLGRGRWHAAFRAFSRAEGAMLRLAPDVLANFRGWLAWIYYKRAMAALGCGRPDVAVADIARATEIQNTTETKFTGMGVAIARAELALYQNRCQDARAELQRGLAASDTPDYAKLEPETRADLDLLTARIARAEGNQEGFTHFCQRALAIAQQHNYRITMSRVRAIMGGAER